MNEQDIIKWGREVWLCDEEGRDDNSIIITDHLMAFAQLVAAAEREACAKLCDDLDDDLPDGLAGWQYGEAIRARGQQ